MFFENSIAFSPPNRGEIRNAVQTLQNNPEDLSERELWILKEFAGGENYE